MIKSTHFHFITRRFVFVAAFITASAATLSSSAVVDDLSGFPAQNPTFRFSSTNDLATTSNDAVEKKAAVEGMSDELAQAIRDQIKALEYSDGTAEAFLKMVGPWECEKWNNRLREAEAALDRKEIDEDGLAKIEEAVVKEIAAKTRKEIRWPTDDGDYSDLANIAKTKKARTFGRTQINYVLFNSVGLSAGVLDILELPERLLGHLEGRSCCFVDLRNGKSIMTENSFDSPTGELFMWEEAYEKTDGIEQLRADFGDNSRLPRRLIRGDLKLVLAYKHFVQAYCLLNQQNRAGAKSEAEVAIKCDPRPSESYVILAYCAFAEEHYPAALDAAEAALQRNPTDLKALSLQGDIYARMDRDEAAIAAYSQTLDLGWKIAERTVRAGYFHLRQGEYAEAKADFAAFDAMPKVLSQVHLIRGALYAKSSQIEPAFADADQSASLDAKQPNAFFLRAETNMRLERYPEAIADFKCVLNLAPNNVGCFYYISTAYTKLGNLKEALNAVNKAIATNGPIANYCYALRAEIYHQLGRNDEAIADADKALEFYPEQIIGILSIRSAAYASLGNYRRAIDDLDQVIKGNPTYAHAYFLRADCKSKLSKNDEALVDADRAIKLAPSNGSFHNMRGQILLQLNRRDEAVAETAKAIQLDPDLNGTLKVENKTVLNYNDASASSSPNYASDPKYGVPQSPSDPEKEAAHAALIKAAEEKRRAEYESRLKQAHADEETQQK